MTDLTNPKKWLGQHFLQDKNIAKKIVDSISYHGGYKQLLEVGAGKGILTERLLESEGIELKIIEIDKDLCSLLTKTYSLSEKQVIQGDFLKLSIAELFSDPIGIIGNFPYNISGQIISNIIDCRNHICEVVGMFQKEVAQRIVAQPCTKAYGIISLLVQAFYHSEYLFTVNPGAFFPVPKVKSGVIRLMRKEKLSLGCNEQLFIKFVKAGFGQRRKKLRNALSGMINASVPQDQLFQKRAEELSVDQFVDLTNKLEAVAT